MNIKHFFMKPGTYLIATTCLLGALSACNKPSTPPPPAHPMETMETNAVENKISEFKSNPSDTAKLAVDRALTDMETEISELATRSDKITGAEKSENDKKLTTMRQQYASYQADFSAAKVAASAKKAGEATGDAMEKVGKSIENAAESVGDAIKSDKPKNP